MPRTRDAPVRVRVAMSVSTLQSCQILGASAGVFVHRRRDEIGQEHSPQAADDNHRHGQRP
jgi:hypothetical protein